MSVKHMTQRGGRVSIPGQVFQVGQDGSLSPEPSAQQVKYLMQFQGMFRVEAAKKPEPKKPEPKKPEPKKPEPKKPEPKKTEAKATPKKAAAPRGRK